MRPFSALLASTFIFAASAALADTRVFIIANQADGYGVDQCLARGDKCGAHAARSYCQSRDFSQATAYRRVDPDEITHLPALKPTANRWLGGTLSRAFATSGPRKRRDAAPRNGYCRRPWPRTLALSARAASL